MSTASPESRVAAKTGVVVLAVTLLLLAGLFNLVDGLAAVTGNHRYGRSELLFGSLTAWGIAWLLFGVLQTGTAYLIFTRQAAGAVLGIALALTNALAHLMFLGVYPAWSIAVMVADGLVIYSLSTHPAFAPPE